jgi:DNA-binding NarL/FixJ family response regulator
MQQLLIADDHAVVRKGIIHILRGEPDITVGGEAASGDEVLQMLAAGSWHALVMDMNMPGVCGLELLKILREQHPQLPVLILSVHPEDQYAVRVIRAGASGYLTKASMPDELVRAIRKVCSGGKYVSESVAEQLAHAMGADLGHPPHQLLSDREFQVLRLMAAGMTPTQIAEKLQISIKTVTTYRARILEKLQMKNSAQLVRYALMEGLVE